MAQITTTIVADSLDDLHHVVWRIVARQGRMAGVWAWTIGIDQDLLLKGRDRGAYQTVQRREPDGSFVLLARLRAPVRRRAA